MGHRETVARWPEQAKSTEGGGPRLRCGLSRELRPLPGPRRGCVRQETVVVFIRPPACVHVQPDRLMSRLQPSPSRQGSISHHCFVLMMRASTQAGRALVVPAICPFLHAQRAVCRAIVLRGWLLSRSRVTISQVPAAS